MWWEFFYCVFNLGNKEFVEVVIWGGGIFAVVVE